MRHSILWFLAIALLFAVIFHGGREIPVPLWDGVLLVSSSLLLPVLAMVGVGVFVLLFGLDFSEPKPGAGELELLLVLKRHMAELPRRSLRRHHSSSGQPPLRSDVVLVVPTDVLERLLQRKRNDRRDHAQAGANDSRITVVRNPLYPHDNFD